MNENTSVPDARYRDIARFSATVGMDPQNLIDAFEIERSFHEAILAETSFSKRQEMYEQVYRTVHAIYGKDKTDIRQGPNPKARVVRLFRKELEGRSVLDIGCGEGHFLASIAEQLPHGHLAGVDTSIPSSTKKRSDIEFVEANIVKFNLARKFDVVFSDQVMEHIAPADLATHLTSVKSALTAGGTFIFRMPNRLFGPSDVTRIMDFSYTGVTAAMGTHLNESTYTEMIPLLEDCGFEDFRTVVPIPKLMTLMCNRRVRLSGLLRVESSRAMLAALRRIQLRGQCVARFDVTLICRKT